MTDSKLNPDSSDESLLAACGSQRPAANRAFALLVRRYEPRVFRTCLRMLGNAADAEDVTQDIFIKVFRKMHAFEGRSSFSTWLFSIARNECLSALSKRSTVDALRAEDPHWDSTPSNDPPLDVELEHRDVLAKTLDRLKSEDREVLVSRFVSGLQIEEIAALLDLSLSAAKMRLYRAMERFIAVFNEISDSPGIRSQRAQD